jgi:hypothetical protein
MIIGLWAYSASLVPKLFPAFPKPRPCRWLETKGSWFWRVFLGILGGAVLTWMYVFLALPNVGVNLAHSIISVFFVSVVGGYLGITVLDLAAKRFGWITT